MAISVALLTLSLGALPLRAQNPETMMPEQSAAKAKELLQQMITVLGGQAYLNARDRDSTGRLSAFGNNGELTGYVFIRDVWKYPDKHRTDYSKRGNIVDLYSGNHGWTLDHAGVHDQPEDAVQEFQNSLKKNLDYILRIRLKEEGLVFRYGGTDLVDMKQAEWVELTDRDDRTLRMAMDRFAHLPLRLVVEYRDPRTRDLFEEVSLYSNWHVINGVNVPFQVTRERNGRKVYQLFISECRVNTGLGDDFFSRAALEKRWKEVGKK